LSLIRDSHPLHPIAAPRKRKLNGAWPPLTESVASLPIFAELVVDDSAAAAPTSAKSDIEIIVGDVMIRAGADANVRQLTRAIRAARASAS